MVSNTTLPFGRLLTSVDQLINPTHQIGHCNFLGSFTAERTMAQAAWLPALLFIPSSDSGSWCHNFQIVFLYFCVCSSYLFTNPLSANPTNRTNTLKQFVGILPMNCFTVFEHFVELALKGLICVFFFFFLINLWSYRNKGFVFYHLSFNFSQFSHILYTNFFFFFYKKDRIL